MKKFWKWLDKDFEETLSVLREVEYDMVFSFIYSKRKGTPAATMPDALTNEEEKEEEREN